ncbi:sigma-E factor regulatory protein RseB domain-containing protein [Streptomyces sp. ACA25]|uniref:LolA family protein n=1 Tax=Streptomyces sp. ACA25 TaxID=3022596 RepID=UPI002307B658|nr:sigma-E factor regulatory protein RseB domain-containing protein [Streptomyces sp. ACA25]MDB1090264.1 sigma-E factor regulatory protein RseB domain-containing protein [Streptomyces sp. ACA25]
MALHRNLRRALVPTAVVAGVAAVGAGLYPALASDGSPELPEVTAEELLVKIAESDTEQLSGTVRVSVDFGFPGMDRMAGALDGPVGRLASVVAGDSTLRVAVDGPDRQRLAIVDGSDEFSIIHKTGDLWAYDSASNTAYRATAPEYREHAGGTGAGAFGFDSGLTPQEVTDQLLADAGEYADISVEGTARVAGQAAYQLLVEPKDGDGSVESVRVAVDAETGVPLAVTVKGSGKPLLDVSFSQINYERPAGGSFDFTPPKDATVIDLNEGGSLEGLFPGFLGHF